MAIWKGFLPIHLFPPVEKISGHGYLAPTVPHLRYLFMGFPIGKFDLPSVLSSSDRSHLPEKPPGRKGDFFSSFLRFTVSLDLPGLENFLLLLNPLQIRSIVKSGLELS